MNELSPERRDSAGGLDVKRKIQGQRAGMEQIKRPQILGAASQVGAARRLSDNRWAVRGVGSFWHGLFVPRLSRVAPPSSEAMQAQPPDGTSLRRRLQSPCRRQNL